MATVLFTVLSVLVIQLLSANSVKKPQIPDICKQTVSSGVCMAYFRRWYFDKNNNTCLEFIYGGCGGNKNNFETKDLCEKTCKISNGPCKDLQRKLMSVASIMVLGAPIGPGNYTPSCDEDGYFKPKQCYRNNTECWCVDRFGYEMNRKLHGPAHSLHCS